MHYMRDWVGAAFVALGLTCAVLPYASATASGIDSPAARRAAVPCTSSRDGSCLLLDRHTPPGQSTLPVTMTVTTGYGDQYRTSAWAPVRVTLRNHRASEVQGTLLIPEQSGGFRRVEPSFHSLYRTSVVLPANGTKQVTIYMPGTGIASDVNAQFLVNGKVIASARDAPVSVDDSTISIGALTDDPQATFWTHTIQTSSGIADVLPVKVGTIDRVWQALNSFDVIVVSNVGTSTLDADQQAALLTYVRNGGALLLVGGPTWQEGLRPLMPSLVPGTLSGDQTVPNLSALQRLGFGTPPSQRTVVSVLRHPRGTVVVTQSGIPLVVRESVGKGRLLYLGFDPGLTPILHWRGASTLLTDLVMQAAPQAATRSTPLGFRPRFLRRQFGAEAMRTELGNVPGPYNPVVIFLIVLAGLSLLIVGPLNFLLLYRLKRWELAWITIPTLAVVCLGSSVAAASGMRGRLAVVNTVSVAVLNGSNANRPATLYMGLFAPIAGNYNVVMDGASLPQGLPEYTFGGWWGGGTRTGQGTGTPQAPVALQFDEGHQTALNFLSMKMWTTRSVAMQTTFSIPGTVHGSLVLSRDGGVIGTVTNGTGLNLEHPVILAGTAILHLPDMAPGSTRTVRVRPAVDTSSSPALFWGRVYSSGPDDPAFSQWDGDPWEEPQPAAETTMIDRLRNVGVRLPEARDVRSWGEVLFAGWTRASMGKLQVDGVMPQRRDLTLILSPMTIHLVPGAFRILPGTLGASLIEEQSKQPTTTCCFDNNGSNSVAVAAGGYATFQFTIPHAGSLHFKQLAVAVQAGGAGGFAVGEVYDWKTGTWIRTKVDSTGVRLAAPDRFVSSSGALMLRIRATRESGDLLISDPSRDVQISGAGTVG